MENPSLRQLASQGSAAALDHLANLERLARQAGDMAQMDYGFLFNHAQRQLAIGYNVGEHRLDASYYDLLASEARLCNFVAIAQGELPQESWFALGAHAYQLRRRSDFTVLERLDVRVSHAAAGNAHVR